MWSFANFLINLTDAFKFWNSFICAFRCAGEIAAVPNTYCAVGVAYGAKVSGKKAFLLLPIIFACVSQYFLSKKWCVMFQWQEFAFWMDQWLTVLKLWHLTARCMSMIFIAAGWYQGQYTSALDLSFFLIDLVHKRVI